MLRRTIQDLIARYVLEPAVRDVYVEGAFDERVLRLLFKEHGCGRPTINVIDLVEIPDMILEKHNLTRGEKAELLALAAEVREQLGTLEGFTAVVDADFDRVLGQVSDNPLVLTTDFTSMEMYWIEASTIERFYTWIGSPGSTIADFVRDVSTVAKDLFLIRCSLVTLSVGARVIPIRKYCTRSGRVLTLDRMRYCRSLLISAGAGKLESEFLTEMGRLGTLLEEDLRYATYGHDLAELIFVAYRDAISGLGLKDIESVKTMIKMSIPIHRLPQYPLFQQLLGRAC